VVTARAVIRHRWSRSAFHPDAATILLTAEDAIRMVPSGMKKAAIGWRH